jgi:hypothetical protein
MAAALPLMYPDQFKQNSVVGSQDLRIMDSKVMSGVLAASETGYLIAGSRVKFDSANTQAGKLVFVAASDDETAHGVIIKTAQKTQFTGGDMIEVAYSGGPVVYFCASTTIAPGTGVGQATGFLVAADGTHSTMGLLIDAAVESAMVRVIIGHVAC